MEYEKICKNPDCKKVFKSKILAQRYCCSACKAVMETARQKKKNEMNLGQYRQCRMCGKTFKVSRKLKAFCSYECRAHYKLVPDGKYEYECDCCHKMFLSAIENKKFCSERCRKIGKKKKIVSIDEIAKAARKEGISYGEYVCKYNV